MVRRLAAYHRELYQHDPLLFGREPTALAARPIPLQEADRTMAVRFCDCRVSLIRAQRCSLQANPAERLQRIGPRQILRP